MFKLELVLNSDGLMATGKLLRRSDKISKACIAITNTKSQNAVSLADFPKSDLIIIDESRPNRDVLVNIANVLNIETHGAMNIYSIKLAIIEHSSRLKSVSKFYPFNNVRLIVISFTNLAIVVDKSVISATQNLSPDESSILSNVDNNTQLLYLANSVISRNASRLLGAQKALGSLKPNLLNEKSVYDALSVSCELNKCIDLPSDINQRLSFLKLTNISNYFPNF